MSRELRRVPVDFEWPMSEVWSGYQIPADLSPSNCPDCKSGYSPRAEYLHSLWYGYVPFKPEDNGSTPFTIDTPAVRTFAEQQVSRAPDFYGEGEFAIQREAERLIGLWNGSWSHHLNEGDVAALVDGGRLMDLTHTWDAEKRWQPKEPPYMPSAQEVNVWSLCGFGHDSINCYVVIKARCKQEGVADTCTTCGGSASAFRDSGHKAAYDSWEPTEPPKGEGWQIWETVSEGSPVTPVFATRNELVDHLCSPGQRVTLREGPMAREEAEAFVTAEWVPSFIGSGRTGLVEGALTPGVDKTLAEIDSLPEGN